MARVVSIKLKGAERPGGRYMARVQIAQEGGEWSRESGMVMGVLRDQNGNEFNCIRAQRQLCPRRFVSPKQASRH